MTTALGDRDAGGRMTDAYIDLLVKGRGNGSNVVRELAEEVQRLRKINAGLVHDHNRLLVQGVQNEILDLGKAITDEIRAKVYDAIGVKYDVG